MRPGHRAVVRRAERDGVGSHLIEQVHNGSAAQALAEVVRTAHRLGHRLACIAQHLIGSNSYCVTNQSAPAGSRTPYSFDTGWNSERIQECQRARDRSTSTSYDVERALPGLALLLLSPVRSAVVVSCPKEFFRPDFGDFSAKIFKIWHLDPLFFSALFCFVLPLLGPNSLQSNLTLSRAGSQRGVFAHPSKTLHASPGPHTCTLCCATAILFLTNLAHLVLFVAVLEASSSRVDPLWRFVIHRYIMLTNVFTLLLVLSSALAFRPSFRLARSGLRMSTDEQTERNDLRNVAIIGKHPHSIGHTAQ
jgi:hypothetical protein